jgi:hypothetical protein
VESERLNQGLGGNKEKIYISDFLSPLGTSKILKLKECKILSIIAGERYVDCITADGNVVKKL